MRKPVAVINSACFPYLKFSHLSRNLLPFDQDCISLSLVSSRLVPSRPVPSRPFPLSLFPSSLHAFSISPHILSSRPVSHFLSFPFLLLFPPTPPSNPPHHPTLVHHPPFYHPHQHQVIPALTPDSSYLCRRLELVNFFFIWVVYSSFI